MDKLIREDVNVLWSSRQKKGSTTDDVIKRVGVGVVQDVFIAWCLLRHLQKINDDNR